MRTISAIVAKIGCLAFLTACAYNAETRNASNGVETGEQQRARDGSAPARGDNQKHVQLPRTRWDLPAGTGLPTRIAYSYFEQGNYGKAIIHANEALKHNPNDSLAISIAAIGGLRVSSDALSELRRINNLRRGTEQEVEVLVKILRTRLGQKILIPDSDLNRTR